MPITLTVPEGLLSSDAEAQVFAELTDALLNVSQLSGNAFMTANIVGTINVLPEGRVFSGGKPAAAAFIELKLPGVALVTAEAKQAFIQEATTIVERASNGQLARTHIWANIVYAVDGSWGIAGQAYDNIELVNAIQQATPLQKA